MATTYEYGRFTPQDARELTMKVATITTHADPETGQPGQTYGPYTVLYVTGKRYVMLLPADFHSFDQVSPEAVVDLDYVAQVQVASTASH